MYVYVCVCLTPRHEKQQGALLYHCSSIAGNERAVLLFSSVLSLALCLFMSLTHSCCLWELSVSVSVERWAVITSNAQAGIKTGAGGEQCRCCSALVIVSFSSSLSHSWTAWQRVGGGVSRQGLNSSRALPPCPDEVCDLDLCLEKGISEMWGLSPSLFLCLHVSLMGKWTMSTMHFRKKICVTKYGFPQCRWNLMSVFMQCGEKSKPVVFRKI